MNRRRIFKKKSLLFEGAPSSLPLVLPSCCSFNNETHQLTVSRVSSDCDSPKLKLIPETLKLLEKISKPLAVVSICGPYRSGKSYFLSRLLGLGNEETFKLGHTMEACTRGIWMASSILECDDFALLLLDTEGIDAADSEKSGVADMLSFTLLVTSMLVYNSRNVPRRKDLQKLSCLASCALSMLADGGALNQDKKYLPNFLWLLRDVDSIPVDTDGKEVPPTQFLFQTLKNIRSSQARSTLLHCFPSLHCITIPPPSSNHAILSQIMNNHQKLSPLFNKGVDEATGYILDNVEIKRGYNSNVELNGSMLACLIEQYFRLITDAKHKIPTFQVSWLTAVEVRLKKTATSLLDEYDKDMEDQVRDKYPMRDGQHGESGDTLINIHLQVFAKKRLKLQKEILTYQHSSDKMTSIEEYIISAFDSDVAEYDESNQVIGGRLLKFVLENYKLSGEFCTSLYNRKYRDIVYTKLHNALHTQIPTEINQELSVFTKEYFEGAVGPSSNEVYKKLRQESSKLEADLELIPGPVQSLEVVGVDSDRVKLRWIEPLINARSVDHYEVIIKSKGKDWEVISTRKGFSVLVTGLESSKWYCLSVCAVSKNYHGKKILFIRVRTLLSKSIQNTIHASTIVGSPVVYPCMVAYIGSGYISKGIQSKSPLDVLQGGLVLSMVPFTAVIGMTPIAGSLASSDTYRHEVTDRKGDLSENDTEVLHFKLVEAMIMVVVWWMFQMTLKLIMEIVAES